MSASATVRDGTPALSLVVPCYNEARNIPLLVQRIEESFVPGCNAEVILVDNGSTDDSPAILSAMRGHPVIRSTRVDVNQGYGFGILAGLAVARGSYLGWTHADMQADPADALRALELINAERGVERYVKGKRHGRPLSDVIFTVGMSAFETVLLRTPLWDINAQPNVFPRAFYDAVRTGAPHDFSLDLYFYHAARQRGLRVERLPVRFGARAHGVSHWNVDWRGKRRFIERTVRFSLELRQRLTLAKRERA